jgi:hypothetical protein
VLGALGGQVPSQAFAFQLVLEAISSDKTIVIGRPKAEKDRWMRCVPALADHDVIVGQNPQRPYITSGNLGSRGFERIVAAVKAGRKVDHLRRLKSGPPRRGR